MGMREQVQEKLDKALNLLEADMPKVGLFWVLPGPNGELNVLNNAYSIKDAQMYSGVPRTTISAYSDGQFHADVWPDIGTETSDYEFFPRGRVDYFVNGNTAVITADKKILKNKDAINKIKSIFNLKGSVETAGEPQYTSQIKL